MTGGALIGTLALATLGTYSVSPANRASTGTDPVLLAGTLYLMEKPPFTVVTLPAGTLLILTSISRPSMLVWSVMRVSLPGTVSGLPAMTLAGGVSAILVADLTMPNPAVSWTPLHSALPL